MSEGVVLRDANGLIIDCNASAERIMGSTLAQIRGKRFLNPAWRAFREDGSPLPDSERPTQATLNSRRAHSNQVIGFRRADGTMLWLSMTTQPLFGSGGDRLTGVVNTFTDITDRRRDEGLRAAKEAAEIASLSKSAFLARMSHELRTPLNSILGFAQLLQYDPAVHEDEKSQKKVGHILEAGHHLMAMVDEILELSRIEAGAMSMSSKPAEIDNLLVDAMSGSIEVRSTPGRGTTFTLVFRRVAAGVEARNESLPPMPAPPVVNTRQAMVLYVEDNPANVELVRDSLAMNPNIRLEVATDGNSGLAAAKRLRPDLILLDINLPGMDGFSILRHLREEPLLAAVPCIALSANAMPKEIQRARTAGFADYITKPFDVRALLATIDAHLQKNPSTLP